MIIDNTQTIVVEPNATAKILSRHVILDIKSSTKQVDDATVVDPIKLSIFGHRFMSVAGQMSWMFQKASVSTNINVHMTNTRITDAEVYELRYTVILRQFSIRRGSGGVGRFRGGDGVIRELEFCMPLSVSMLSE